MKAKSKENELETEVVGVKVLGHGATSEPSKMSHEQERSRMTTVELSVGFEARLTRLTST